MGWPNALLATAILDRLHTVNTGSAHLVAFLHVSICQMISIITRGKVNGSCSLWRSHNMRILRLDRRAPLAPQGPAFDQAKKHQQSIVERDAARREESEQVAADGPAPTLGECNHRATSRPAASAADQSAR
jgi:hypothetical protein